MSVSENIMWGLLEIPIGAGIGFEERSPSADFPSKSLNKQRYA